MNPAFLVVLVVGVAGSSAGAQEAIVAVTHNDPTGVVAPGQTIQISVTVSWTASGSFLEEIRGGVRAIPNLGSASDPRFPYMHYSATPSTIVNPGTVVGGGVVGLHLQAYGAIWVWSSFPEPWNHSHGFEVLRFDWTAPLTPASVSFEFAPDPAAPNPTFLGPITVTPFTVPTTFLGTSLTVIPAPPVAAVAGLGLALSARRRRRPARERHAAW